MAPIFKIGYSYLRILKIKKGEKFLPFFLPGMVKEEADHISLFSLQDLIEFIKLSFHHFFFIYSNEVQRAQAGFLFYLLKVGLPAESRLGFPLSFDN